MARRLTASDRASLIRLASSLPVGSAERKAILAGLRQTNNLPTKTGTDKQAFSFKEVEPGIYEIGSSFHAITMSPYPPYPTFQLLRMQTQGVMTWEVIDKARGEREFIEGPLARFYEEYFGKDRGPEKLAQDESAIRSVLRKL